MTTSELVWRLRAAVPPRLRGSVRAVTDAVVARRAGSVSGVRTPDRLVALTYDDGPDPVTTPAVLDALADLGVSATFFVLACKVQAAPGLLRQMVEQGHEVALHGWDHARPDLSAGPDFVAGLRAAKTLVEAETGRPVRHYRPPYGAQSPATYRAARAAGLDVVVWTGHAEDWQELALVRHVQLALAGTTPGGVLLLHDAYEGPAGTSGPRLDRAALCRELVHGLRQQGYAPMSVADLLGCGATRRTAWFRP